MKKSIITLSLLALAATANAADLPSQEQTKFNNAVKAYRANHNADALKLFTELYKDFPQNQQVKNNYAVTLFANGKIEQAEEVLSNVIESDKEVNVAFKNLNKIYDYAAAKAYSNALGTDKEVQPQKLQMIESYSSAAEGKSSESIVSSTPEIKVAQATEIPETPKVSDTPIKPSVKTEVKTTVDPISSAVTPPVSSNTTTATPNPPTTTAAAVPAKPEAVKLSPTVLLEVANKMLQSWADAWSKGDVNAYAAFYSPNFAPEGMTHKNWLEGRKLRISPEKKIQVKFTDVVIVPSDKSDIVIVNFKQSYQANHLKDTTNKQLVWKKFGDKWLIEKEIAL